MRYRQQRHDDLLTLVQTLLGLSVILMLVAPWLTDVSVARKLVLNGIVLLWFGCIVWFDRWCNRPQGYR